MSFKVRYLLNDVIRLFIITCLLDLAGVSIAAGSIIRYPEFHAGVILGAALIYMAGFIGICGVICCIILWICKKG